jgi:hypothetical protein
MLQPKTTNVTVNEQEYQLSKMTPAVGSYIWQLLMAACFKAQQVISVQTEAVQEAAIPDKTTPTERLRGLCGISFMQLDFDKYEFIQTNCMKVVARVEVLAGNAPVPMPLMTYDGRWAVPEVADNLMLVTRLMTEALVFNLSSFLAESGAGTQT